LPESAQLVSAVHASGEQDPAESMARLVEKWLDNPISRSMLKFCTARDACGRRVDLALKRYAGQEAELCLKCSAASLIIGGILNSILRNGRLDRKRIQTHLKDP
jgi:hypothetical protein